MTSDRSTTVYKLKKILHDEEGNTYLTHEELQQLLKKQPHTLPEPLAILYFIRRFHHAYFPDSPTIGLEELRFKTSDVEGPFTAPPTPKKEKKSAYEEDIDGEALITKYIPQNKLPSTFEKITLRTFGLSYEQASSYWYAFKRIDMNHIAHVGDACLTHIKQHHPVTQTHEKEFRGTPQTTIRTRHHGSVLEYHLQQGGKGECFTVSFRATIVGRGTAPNEVLTELGLEKILAAITDRQDRDLLVDNWTQQGLAYNFTPDEKTLQAILDGTTPDNIIL